MTPRVRLGYVQSSTAIDGILNSPGGLPRTGCVRNGEQDAAVVQTREILKFPPGPNPLTTAVGCVFNLLRQQRHDGLAITRSHGCEKLCQEALAGFGNDHEAWTRFTHPGERSMHELAAGRFGLANYPGHLGIVVVENFAE